jgi:Ca2+-binding RTX toxin-like protein
MKSKLMWSTWLVGLTLFVITASIFVTMAEAQNTPGPGFHLDASDVRYMLQQVRIGEAHAAQTRMPGNAPNCSVLLGPGPFQVSDPRFPYGLRTVNGTCNNLVPNQEQFGASFNIMPRLTTPFFRTAEGGTSYLQTSGPVIDSRPRIISNLIVDQTSNNPSAVAAAGLLPVIADPASQTFFIPNVAPDLGISAPYNALFTFFGQFFDHGLTFLRKGGNGTVIVPLQADDPLNVCSPPLQCAFATPGIIPLNRATMLPGPDGIPGNGDDIHEATNEDTPWIDQNQTYTSHPSHQVFLRQYQLVAGKPVPTGKMLDGAIAGNIGSWAEVRAQAANLLGIQLQDVDVLNVPLLLTDPYGHFVPGPNGFPQVAMPGGVFVEGNPGAPVSVVGSLKAETPFLCDIAHAADPSNPQFDSALLGAHFATGDCRGNENIALTMIHNVLHSEHNRLATEIDGLINTLMTPAEIAIWKADNPASGWGYGERLFQAARFVTEQEYQRIVVDTFARKVQPEIHAFAGSKLNLDPATLAEYAHATYRFGHSMLNETINRTNADGSVNDIRLLDAFLNPHEYNNDGKGGQLTAAQVIGATARGLSREVGNELDEFVTQAVRNQLVGLPLDLPAINITRGRSEGVAPLNVVRQQLFAASGDQSVVPYKNWIDFWLAMRHPESLVNFVAAYGTDPTITGATTVVDKRAAAFALICLQPTPGVCLVNTSAPLLVAPAATSGLDDVDLWVGGLAEKPSIFGGLLGSTHNFIFQEQIQRLQDFDRFYYVARSKGLNLINQLEQNSLSELIMRNSDAGVNLPDDPFSHPTFVFDIANLTPADLALLTTLPDGTLVYTGNEHLLVICGVADCRFTGGDNGDDTIRGGPGNDRLNGGGGKDHVMGGPGDDIITNTFDDDTLEGGDGNDAISCGPNLGGAIMFGGSGQDFMVASDPCQGLGGPGNDFLFAGNAAKNPVGKEKGEEGDDWVEGGFGDDDLIGDCDDPLEGLVDFCQYGNDVLIAGGSGGDLGDEMLGEGGDDIMAPGTGKTINRGGFGFDWDTYKLKPTPADADLNILIIDPLDVNFLRDRFSMVEALSGSPFNDMLLGDNRIFGGRIFDPAVAGQTCDPVVAQGVLETTFYCNELSPAGIANITGLNALTAGRTLLPGDPHAGTFAHGNIILGGPGSDMIMGRDGDDIIDGDAWLNVQLKATLNDSSVKLVDSMQALIADVFADPQRLNPGNITIVRSIVGHTGAAGTDVDTAVYRKIRSFYTVTPNADGSITVTDNDPKCVAGDVVGRALQPCDGTDTLWNIERIAFPDGTLNTATNLFTPKAGLGAALNITPSALSFPTQVVGTTSLPQVITVANPSPVQISLFSFVSTVFNGAVNAADFGVTSNCPGLLAPSASCTVNVTFTPLAFGTRSAVLAVSSNDPLNPLSIPLAGVGRLPDAAPVFTSSCPTTGSVGVAYACSAVATNPNGDPQTYSLVTAPAGMVINSVSGVISWTPIAQGTFLFTVRVTDTVSGLSSTQDTFVTVTVVPGAPLAVIDSAKTNAGKAITIQVLANDVASPGSTLVPGSVRIVTPPSKGTATVVVKNGRVVYTPNPGFRGVDTFTYDVKDNLGRMSNPATVNVTVK